MISLFKQSPNPRQQHKYLCHKELERVRSQFYREKARMLDKLWDDVLAGPQPERGLGKLRKIMSSKPLTINSDVGEKSSGGEGSKLTPTYQRAASMPTTPTTPGTPSNMSMTPRDKLNVWRSVFNPGSNSATRSIGSDIFDKPQPNSPTVYDWLYSGETRSNHR